MQVYNEAGVNRFFRVESADVAANRAGYLGPGQRRGYRVTLVIWSVMLAIWVGAMGFAITIQLDGDAWHGVGNLVATLVLVILIAAVPVLMIRGSLRMLSSGVRVQRLTGQVVLGTGFLTVDGRRLRIPRPMNGQGGRGPFLSPHVDQSLTYDVFVVRGRVLSMVRAG